MLRGDKSEKRHDLLRIIESRKITKFRHHSGSNNQGDAPQCLIRLKNWKHAASTPEYLDFKVKDPDSWRKAKSRMTVDRDRIDWTSLAANYKTWREEGRWITAGLWFGFDVTHSWAVGTERLLEAMVFQPEWVVEIVDENLHVPDYTAKPRPDLVGITAFTSQANPTHQRHCMHGGRPP